MYLIKTAVQEIILTKYLAIARYVDGYK